MSKSVLDDYFGSIDVDYDVLKDFNVLINELELFARVNNIDLYINITDNINHNTRLVMDIEL